MKLSLLIDTRAEGSTQRVADVRARFAEPDPIFGEVDVEIHELPDATFDAQRAALSAATGDRVAWLASGASVDDLVAVLRARAASRDNEVTAALQEPKLTGRARWQRFTHRVVCRLGGRRSPPDPQGTSWVVDRAWLPALLQVPAGSDLDVPLMLAALDVRWERLWGTAPAAAPLAFGAAFKRGWRRLLLVGGVFELGLLIALGFYGLFGVLAMLGSQSSWAIKGILGLVLGALTALALGLVQILARRRLRGALRVGSDVRDALIAPPGWSSN